MLQLRMGEAPSPPLQLSKHSAEVGVFISRSKTALAAGHWQRLRVSLVFDGENYSQMRGEETRERK